MTYYTNIKVKRLVIIHLYKMCLLQIQFPVRLSKFFKQLPIFRLLEHVTQFSCKNCLYCKALHCFPTYFKFHV